MLRLRQGPRAGMQPRLLPRRRVRDVPVERAGPGRPAVLHERGHQLHEDRRLARERLWNDSPAGLSVFIRDDSYYVERPAGNDVAAVPRLA